MANVSELEFSRGFEKAADGCCGTATGFAFSHPGAGKKGSRYYVHTAGDDVFVQHLEGGLQALDEVPDSLALNIIGAWIRSGNIHPLASSAPRSGERAECTVK